MPFTDEMLREAQEFEEGIQRWQAMTPHERAQVETANRARAAIEQRRRKKIALAEWRHMTEDERFHAWLKLQEDWDNHTC